MAALRALPLYAVVVLAPLPLGSADPLSVAAWCIVLAVGLVVAPPADLGPARVAMLAGIAVVAGGYGLVVSLQLASSQGVPLADPIWSRAGPLLGLSAPYPNALVKGQPFYGLGPSLACLMALSLGILVGSDRGRGRRLLLAVAWAGCAYSAYGIVSAILDPTMVLWTERPGYYGNVIGTFLLRNTAASYFGSCATLWVLLVCEIVRERVPSGTMSWKRFSREVLNRPTRRLVSHVGAGFVCLSALLMSASRAGVIISSAVMLAVVTVMFWEDLRRRLDRRWLWGAVALVPLGLLQVLSGSVSNRFAESGLSDENRFDIYRAMARMIADHPWIGTGLGTFPSIFPSYRGVPPSLWGIWEIGHSTPLETAVEVGLPLALLDALAVVAMLAMFVRGVRVRRRDRVVPLAGAAVLVIASVHSSIDFPLQIPGFALVVMGLFGVALAQSVSRRPAAAPAPPAPSTPEA